MTMSHDWFYHEHIPSVGATAELDAAEARHALGARRLQVGESITLFDGQGTSAIAALQSADKRHTIVEITERTTHEKPKRTITLASALPKGDRQAVMLSMAAQLGIARFIPLHCERSVAKVSKGFESRTQRIFIEACKQSRQPFVPVIDAAMTPKELSRADVGSILVADPAGAPITSQSPSTSAITLVIGPEGGFAEHELRELQSPNAALVSLGESILRIETAAVAMCTWARLFTANS